jgi:glutathione S-transferase
VTLADVFLVPHLFSAKRNSVDLTKYPTLLRINDICLELDAFKKAHPYVQVDCPTAEKITL